MKSNLIKYLLFLCGVLMAMPACDSGGTDGEPPVVTPPTPPGEKGDLAGRKKILFDSPFDAPIKSYWLTNTATKTRDPQHWSLWGSDDSENWKLLDERIDQAYSSRCIEKECSVKEPGKYAKYALMVTLPNGDTLTDIGTYGFRMFREDITAGWENFSYPEIVFNDRNPETNGSTFYKNLVSDPDAYIKYHAMTVCRILFWTADNPENRYDIRKVTYNLEDYDGVSGKSGSPPNITIALSTRHVENTARSMTTAELSDETRGCLMHEMTHGYQNEPRGCGGYQSGTEFFAAIEGMADAVRIDAGLHATSTPNPDAHWKDGYTNTGFFIQWMRTKDTDALRKFHDSMRTIDPWSFDAGVKAVFGPNTTIDGLWNEYVQYIRNNPKYHHYEENTYSNL